MGGPDLKAATDKRSNTKGGVWTTEVEGVRVFIMVPREVHTNGKCFQSERKRDNGINKKVAPDRVLLKDNPSQNKTGLDVNSAEEGGVIVSEGSWNRRSLSHRKPAGLDGDHTDKLSERSRKKKVS